MNIEEKLTNEIAIILSKKPEEISFDEPLHAMGLDSLSFVELLVSIEKIFNLKLMDTNLAQEDFGSIKILAARIRAMIK
ncbi:hypothetical protein MNBD_UNCLBAC01-1366 [hydrothermal vent metagenome]|uniref:Carrier domain-containing protein n=1 Tax=hydrothermal vent metagenome TaxID=652676 RepID=A0A3B1D5F0_9ZZZZ